MRDGLNVASLTFDGRQRVGNGVESLRSSLDELYIHECQVGAVSAFEDLQICPGDNDDALAHIASRHEQLRGAKPNRAAVQHGERLLLFVVESAGAAGSRQDDGK